MIEARTETPDRWLTSGLRRARRVISATISFMYCGTNDVAVVVVEAVHLLLHDRRSRRSTVRG